MLDAVVIADSKKPKKENLKGNLPNFLGSSMVLRKLRSPTSATAHGSGGYLQILYPKRTE